MGGVVSIFTGRKKKAPPPPPPPAPPPKPAPVETDSEQQRRVGGRKSKTILTTPLGGRTDENQLNRPTILGVPE